jgi:AGZA family xanthine/uracil permease-like MFS transporter
MLGIIMYVLMKTGIGRKGIRRISPTVWVLFMIFVLRYVQKSL